MGLLTVLARRRAASGGGTPVEFDVIESITPSAVEPTFNTHNAGFSFSLSEACTVQRFKSVIPTSFGRANQLVGIYRQSDSVLLSSATVDLSTGTPGGISVSADVAAVTLDAGVTYVCATWNPTFSFWNMRRDPTAYAADSRVTIINTGLLSSGTRGVMPTGNAGNEYLCQWPVLLTA